MYLHCTDAAADLGVRPYPIELAGFPNKILATLSVTYAKSRPPSDTPISRSALASHDICGPTAATEGLSCSYQHPTPTGSGQPRAGQANQQRTTTATCQWLSELVVCLLAYRHRCRTFYAQPMNEVMLPMLICKNWKVFMHCLKFNFQVKVFAFGVCIFKVRSKARSPQISKGKFCIFHNFSTNRITREPVEFQRRNTYVQRIRWLF